MQTMMMRMMMVMMVVVAAAVCLGRTSSTIFANRPLAHKPQAFRARESSNIICTSIPQIDYDYKADDVDDDDDD